jgi:hypothetical protein
MSLKTKNLRVNVSDKKNAPRRIGAFAAYVTSVKEWLAARERAREGKLE